MIIVCELFSVKLFLPQSRRYNFKLHPLVLHRTRSYHKAERIGLHVAIHIQIQERKLGGPTCEHHCFAFARPLSYLLKSLGANSASDRRQVCHSWSVPGDS